eukprot:3796688-Amphidinium_carterae.1
MILASGTSHHRNFAYSSRQHGCFCPQYKYCPQADVQANMKSLLAIDRCAEADVLFLKHVCGDGGAMALQKRFEDQCLPTEIGDRSLGDAVKSADALEKSDLFDMLTTEKQAQMKSAISVVRSLDRKQRPTVISSGTDWLQKVWLLIARFFAYSEPAADDETKSVTCYGTAAMHKYLASITENDKTATADELDQIDPWASWLDSEMATKLAEAKKKSQAKAKTEGKKKPAAKAKPAAVERKVSSAEADAEQAVMAMLRRKRA